ncbi:MAG: phosphohydrolase [Pelagimonas sp.]
MTFNNFSYKRPVLEEMAKTARSILVLDHHESAERELAGFPFAKNVDDYHFGAGITAQFDMSRSGAQLAWDFFRPGYGPRRPALIDYVADRDLWRFELPSSREINEAINNLTFDFDVWSDLSIDMQDFSYRSSLARSGADLMKRTFSDVTQIISLTERDMRIGGHVVKVANCPKRLASDVAGELSHAGAFGACYYDGPKGRVFSLRQRSDGIPVNAIAELYGGGGHPKAAGFTMPIGWEGDNSLSSIKIPHRGPIALSEKIL